MTSALPTNLSEECRKCAKVLRSFTIPDDGTFESSIIPPEAFEKAKGVAVLCILKAGFLFSGRIGNGLVTAKLPDGSWSAPCAIGTAGIGGGFQVGAELTEFVFILRSQGAVEAFSHGNLTLGGNLSIAAGPLGRTGEASGAASMAAIWSYCKSKGLFAGISLEGSALIVREETNTKFYGKTVHPLDLLTGRIPPPKEASVLFQALEVKTKSGGPPSPRSPSPRPPSPTPGPPSPRTGPPPPVPLHSRPTAPGTPPDQSLSPHHPSPQPHPYPPPQPGYAPQPAYPPPQPGYAPQPAYPPPQSGYAPQPYPPPQPGYATQPYPPPQHGHYPGNPPPVPGGRPGGNPAPAPAPAPAPIPTPMPPLPPRVGQSRGRALFDFVGQEAGDLPFRKGDIITITKKTESQNDWWEGSLGGKAGSFPANYVEMI